MSLRRYLRCDHSGKCFCTERTYWIAFGLALIIFLIEYYGGHHAKSLALISDAFHALTDGLVFFVAILVERFVQFVGKRNTAKREAVARCAMVWGGYFNATILIAIALYILFEAFLRFLAPYEVLTGTMIQITFLGMLLNILQNVVLHLGVQDKGHAIFKSLSIHVLSDLYQSAGVLLAGFAIWFTGYNVLDPIASVLVASWMMRKTKELFKEGVGAGTGHQHH